MHEIWDLPQRKNCHCKMQSVLCLDYVYYHYFEFHQAQEVMQPSLLENLGNLELISIISPFLQSDYLDLCHLGHQQFI